MAGSARIVVWAALLFCGACLNHASFGVADLGGSTLQSRITYLLADGVDAADVVVSLRQADGTPAVGVAVTASCESCVIDQAPESSDANGQVTVLVRSSVAGTRLVQAVAKRGAFSQTLSSTLPLLFYPLTTDGNVTAGQTVDLQVLARSDTAGQAAFSGAITFTSTDPRATLPPAQTLMPDEHGHRLIPGELTFFTAGQQTIEAVDAARQTVVFSETFAVAAGPAKAFDLTGLPTATTAGVAHTVQVRPQDAYGNAVATYGGTVSFQSSDGRAQLPGDYHFTFQDGGEHTFDGLVLVKAGMQTLTIQDANDIAAATTFQSDVAPSALAALNVACSGLVAGVPCAATLQAQDLYGNVVSDFVATVALSTNDPNATLPASVTLNANDLGEANLSVTATVAKDFYVQASVAAPQIATKSYLPVAPGPLDHLTFLGLDACVTVGQNLTVQLQAQDMFDNVNAAYRGIVSLTSTDVQASLSANTLSFSAADAGELVVPCAFRTTGMQQLQATDVVTGLSVQANTTVLSGNSVQALAIRGMPVVVTAGVPIASLMLQAVDAYGNPETHYAGTVAFSSTDALAQPVAPVTFTTMGAGLASVAGNVVLRTAGTQTVVFTDTQSSNLKASQTVTVLPAAPVATKFLQAPASAAACATFAQAVTVAASDVYNNTVPLQGPARVTLLDNDATGTPALLVGPAIANPTQGVATFAGLRIMQAGSDYQLVATASGLSATTSGNFVVAQLAPTVILDQVTGSSGTVSVGFDVQSACPATLTLSWSPNDSGGWSTATLLPGSDLRVSTTASGLTFLWDSVHDLPATTLPGAMLRLSAAVNGWVGTAQSSPFTLDNGSSWQSARVLAQAAGAQTCIAHADLHLVGWDDLVTCDVVNHQIDLFAAQGNGLFAAPQSLALGGAPASITIADFDRNGLLDLLVAVPTANAVSIFLASAPGVFASAIEANLGSGPQAVRVADINADGAYDLVVTQGSAQALAWALGAGNGNVAAYSTGAVGRGPRDLELVPMNRDAWLDAVVLNQVDATVSLLLGAPGSFQTALASVAVGANPRAMATTDINRDGLLDVVVTCAGEVDVLLGAAGGLMQAQAFALSAAADAMAVADINRDGVPDVLVGTATPGQAWGVLFGDGTGHLTTPALAFSAPTGLHGVGVYDLDHDSRPDLVGVGTTGALYAATNATPRTPGRGLTSIGVDVLATGPDLLVADDFNGDGKKDVIALSLGGQLYTFLAGDGMGHLVDAPSVSTLGAPADIEVADFNGDGAPDFAISSTTDDRVAIYINHGDANFTMSVTPYLGDSAGALSAADLDGDGKVDLAVVVAARNGVVPCFGDGNGTFASGALIPTDYQPVSVVVGDVNNDGLPDVVTANAAFSTYSSTLGTGHGTFGTPLVTPGRCGATMLLGDADHDGALDAFVNCDGFAIVYGGDGAGYFPNTLAYAGGGWSTYTLTVGDINRDGWLDWAYPSSGILQAFGPPQNMRLIGAPFVAYVELLADMDNDGWEDLVIGDGDAVTIVPNVEGSLYGTQLPGWIAGADASFVDINGDGIDDAFSTYWGNAYAVSPQPQYLVAYLGDGTGAFNYAYATVAGPQSYGNVGRIQHGDFNHDGWSDMLLTDRDSGLFNVWMNTGDGNLLAAQSYTISFPDGAVIADIDHDGDLDVAIASTYGGVYTLANDGTGQFGAASQLFACNAVGPLAYGDLDADGAGDLFSTCSDDGLAVTWMTAAGAADATFTMAVPNVTPQDAALADIDADGDLDLLFNYAGGWGGVGVALNTKNRTFAPATLYPFPASARMYAGALTVGDFDADGMLDVMATAYPKGVALYAATSPGVLGAPLFYGTGTQSPERIIASDVNRDGRLDAATACGGYQVGYSVLLGK